MSTSRDACQYTFGIVLTWVTMFRARRVRGSTGYTAPGLVAWLWITADTRPVLPPLRCSGGWLGSWVLDLGWACGRGRFGAALAGWGSEGDCGVLEWIPAEPQAD